MSSNKNIDKHKHKSGSEKRRLKLKHLLHNAGEEKNQMKLLDLFSAPKPKETGSSTLSVESTKPTSSTEQKSITYHEISKHVDLVEVNVEQKLSDEELEPESLEENQREIPKSQVEAMGYFIAPNKNEALAAKISFIKHHPIQPGSDKCCLLFDPSKVYFRKVSGIESMQRKWLSYAEHNKKVYCSVCMAFGTNREGAFVSGAKVDVKSIYLKVEKHEKSDVHQASVSAYMQVDLNMTIDTLLKSQRLEKVENNRLVLIRIIDIIITLAKQDMAFRAHRHEAAYNLTDNVVLENGTGNQGNFLALVKLVAKYDSILNTHINKSILKSQSIMNERKKLKTCSRKVGRGSLVTFLSKTTFNKIIKIIGNAISLSISKDVIEAKEFSLEVDSTQDVSVTDQLSVCVRYVLNGEVKERLIKMCSQHLSTGEAQYDLIKKELGSLGIDLQNLISNSFDGAANMKGEYKGLQKMLKQDAPTSVYTHCHAHVLNLVIGDSTMCAIAAQNVFDLIQQTAVFFSYSYKRTDLWKRLLSDQVGNEKLVRFQKLGATRWNSKHAALQSIFRTTSTPNKDRHHYVHLIEALHILGYSKTVDPHTSSEARNLLQKWTSFETILTCFIFLHIFEASTPVSAYLQTKGLDYIAAWNKINDLHQKMRVLSTKFDDIYQEVEDFVTVMSEKTEDLENVFVETKLPEKRKKFVKLMSGEKARDESANLDSVTRYRVETFQNIMDNMLSSLERRFSQNKDLMQAFAYLDPKRFVDICNGVLNLDDGQAENPLKRLASLIKLDHSSLVRELKSFATSYDSLSLSLEATFMDEDEDSLEGDRESGDEDVAVGEDDEETSEPEADNGEHIF